MIRSSYLQHGKICLETSCKYSAIYSSICHPVSSIINTTSIEQTMNGLGFLGGQLVLFVDANLRKISLERQEE
jgi:hypothetical protein